MMSEGARSFRSYVFLVMQNERCKMKNGGRLLTRSLSLRGVAGYATVLLGQPGWLHHKNFPSSPLPCQKVGGPKRLEGVDRIWMFGDEL
jgi:hypothetical protein